MAAPSVPVIHGQYRLFGTSTPDQRPGDGKPLSDGTANRSLLDRELFINFGDGVLCTNGANGALRTFYFLDIAGFTSFARTLPTTDPGIPGAPWLDDGTLAFSQ